MAVQAVFWDLGETLITSPRSWLPGGKATLTTQRQQGLRLGIISNTIGLTSRQAILDRLPIDFDLGLFEQALVLFSSEVGIAKPDRKIFELAVSRAAIPAEHCFYCSEDSVETLAAQAAGMHALRIVTGSNDLANMPSFLVHLN